MKEEVNLLKNDSRCGGDVSDLSLYNSKVIWAANAGHLTGPVSQAQGKRGLLKRTFDRRRPGSAKLPRWLYRGYS